MKLDPCGCHRRPFPTQDAAMVAALRVSRRTPQAPSVEPCGRVPGYWHLSWTGAA